jgi:cytoskeletal protein CcmA (bactofilin family)
MFKKINFLAPLLVFFLLFGVVSPAHAQGIVSGDTVPAGTTVDDDLILFGETVTIDGDVNGNIFALGGTVTVNGKVDGSLYALSQQVLVNGEVTDGVYGTALELDFGPEGKVGRNVAFLGLSVSMPEGATIGRDLTGIFILGAQFAGGVERDTTAVIGPLEVVRLIIRMFDIQAPPFLAPQTIAPAGMKLASPVSFDIPQQGIIDTITMQRWLVSMVRDYIALLLVGLLALWLFPGHLKRWGEKVMKAPFSSLGLGLAVVVVGGIGLALFWVLILAVALGLGRIGFSGLGTAMGMLGFFAVSTAGAVLYVIVTFISKLIFAFQAGFLILKRYERTGFWYKLGVLALGLLIYVLVAGIPYIGWAVAIVVMLLGTGAVFLVFNDDRRFEKQAAVGLVQEMPAANPPVEAATVAAQPTPVVEKPAEKSPQPEIPPVSSVTDEKPGFDDKPSAGAPVEEKPAKQKSSRKQANQQED